MFFLYLKFIYCLYELKKIIKIYILLINNRKNESLRDMEIEINKKMQMKTHLNEEIDTIISDADVDSYKKFE